VVCVCVCVCVGPVGWTGCGLFALYGLFASCGLVRRACSPCAVCPVLAPLCVLVLCPLPPPRGFGVWCLVCVVGLGEALRCLLRRCPQLFRA
jgi:hypothetical protein